MDPLNTHTIQITEEMQVEENISKSNRISTSTVLILKRPANNELSTTISKKTKHLHSNDTSKKPTAGIASDFFKEIEYLKNPKIKKEILIRIKYADEHNSIDRLTQMVFEYPQGNGLPPLYFQISTDNPKALNCLKLNIVKSPNDPEMIISLKNETSEDGSKQIEKLLFEHFEAILGEVQKQGYWKLPQALQKIIPASFQKICGFTFSLIGKENDIEQNKELFSCDPDLLKRFCSLKIKEISSWIKTAGKPPRAPVWLSILREQGNDVVITEVELFFEEGVAMMPLTLSVNKYPSLMEALFESSWMEKDSERTIIRLSDHHLEDNLLIKKCCKEIEYGLLSSQIRPRDMGELNFWENLAFNWKRRAKNDFHQIEEVKKTLNENRSNKEVDLTPEIQKLAAFRDDINQIDHVRFIMRNQLAGIGTLLNLPTGFGKTFIIFMAAAQQIKNIGQENKKPYLVIAPASNVVESWKSNHELLVKGLGDKVDPIFSKGSSLCTFDKSPAFFAAYNKKFQGADFIVITRSLLGSIAKKLLSPSLPAHLSKTDSALLRLIGILSLDNFILKDKSFWEKSIRGIYHFWRYQAAVLEQLQKNNLKNIFYTTDQKNLDQKRKAFLSIFGDFCKKNTNVIDSFPEDFLPKISYFNEEGKRFIDPSKLFDYCHCLFFFEKEFNNSKSKEPFLQQLWDRLSPLLADLSKTQKKLIEEYEAFKNHFNGLILDESDQILVTKNGKVSGKTEILLDIAKTFQTRSTKDNPLNPLIIASSATPWPNEMGELKLHLNIILPKLMSEYRDLNDDLFGKWNSFESSLENHTLKSLRISGDQTADPTISPSRQKKKSTTVLIDHFNTIQTHFYQWVRLLFIETVSYEKPIAGQTNNYTEEALYITCDESCPLPEDTMVPSRIKNFYSGVLQNQEDMLKQIFEGLTRNDLFSHYVELTDDAAFLAMKLSDYYKEKFDEEVQIGLFYNESFVKKQKKVSPEYVNITFNTDRMVNINAFNNIFRFEDFYTYLNQYFGKSTITEIKSSIASLVAAIQSVLDKNDQKSNVLAKMRKKIESRIPLIGDEIELQKILVELIELEKKSKKEIIMDFSQELEIFKPFLSQELQAMETVSAFKRYSAETMERVKGKVKMTPIEELKRAFFHYLNRIYQSKILIFGPAGTSGMRIDGDDLTLLSGAWTEGKLNQLKGRAGRLKGAGDSRPCKIHMPITNTIFEFYILRYYIKKALYDQFITSKECIEAKDLFQQLTLSGLLLSYYNRCTLEKDVSFLDPSIHTTIQNLIMNSTDYLNLGAYEKALKIIPQSIHDEMQEFNQIIFNDNVITPKNELPPLFDEKDIAEELWLDPDAIITEDYVQKVNLVANYLKEQGMQLKGVKGDGNCFCNALLGSYRTLSKKIPLLESQLNPSKYLRELIALQYLADNPTDSKRAQIIKKDREWLYFDREGDKLALLLDTPIRMITVQGSGIHDAVTPKKGKSEEHILMVDLGGHFLYAQPISQEKVLNSPLVEMTLIHDSDNPAKTKQPPPKIRPAQDAAWSHEELERVKKQVSQSGKEKVVIFIVPTRGVLPDIPIKEFSNYVKASIKTNYFPIVIYGINHPEGIERIIDKPPESASFFPKITPFTWREEDRLDKVPPIGQMRNFCLEQAKSVWEALTFGDAPIKDKKSIYLISMDGDTQLTQESFQRIIEKVNQPSYVVATGGYDFAAEDSDWSKRSNRISMGINFGCQTKLKTFNRYYGYLAEPLLAISPSLMQQLFEQERKNSFFQMKDQKKAPFGFWNFEGRRFQRYLDELVKKDLNSFGPPHDNQNMPVLKNYERFITKPPPFSLKLQLSKTDLSTVITRLYIQSQHSIQPYFMGSNIAYYHHQKSGPVRRFAAHFYAKNVLELLNLGPERGMILTKKISDYYRNERLEYSQGDYIKFGVNENEFISFLEQNFGKRQADPSTPTPSEKARKEFSNYALLLAFWARTVFDTLGREFGKTYSDELVKGKYIPMAMPKNYPSKSKLCLDGDEELLTGQKSSLAKVASISFDELENKLFKEHAIFPLDLSYCEKLKCEQIHKIISIFQHNILILMMHQPFENIDQQKNLCEENLKKVMGVFGNTQKLVISLNKGGQVRFTELKDGVTHYTNSWNNGQGLMFAEEDL